MYLSAEEAFSLRDSLDTIAKLVGWIKALLVGAFFLGVWATTLQVRVNIDSDRISTLEQQAQADRQNLQEWQRQISTDVATTRTDVGWIKQEMQKGP